MSSPTSVTNIAIACVQVPIFRSGRPWSQSYLQNEVQRFSIVSCWVFSVFEKFMSVGFLSRVTYFGFIPAASQATNLQCRHRDLLSISPISSIIVKTQLQKFSISNRSIKLHWTKRNDL